MVERFTALRLGAEPTLVAFAVVIGIGSALGVLAFYKGISLAHTAFVVWPALVLPELGLLAFRPIVTAFTFAAAAWIMRVIGRGHEGMNVPDIQASVEHRGGRIAPRPALGRTLASAVTIGGGGSAGAEGPVVVIGATLGSWLGRMFRFKPGRLRVLVACNLAQHSQDTVRRFEAAVAASPAIVECRSTTGEADYMMTVLVPDIQAYERFLHDTLFRLPGVTQLRSAIVLKEVKAEVRLPLEIPAAKPPRARRA